MNGLLELCLQRLAWCGPLENLSPAMLESLVSQHPDQCWGQPLSAEQLLYWPTSMQQWDQYKRAVCHVNVMSRALWPF